MRYGRTDAAIRPRNGHTLIVLIPARISGCFNQKELSLGDQVDHGKQVIAEMYDGPVEYRVVATKGKGERLDRPELEQIEAELRKSEADFCVMDDLGRLVRGAEAVRLLGVGVDHGTRCISPNDCVDTIEPTWEEDALSACRDHVGHNAHTSRRLKQKLMNRFKKFGGAPARPVAGYVVPPDAKTYFDWRKVDAATPVIAEGFRVLGQTLNGEAVAEYFNGVPWKDGTGFPPGPYCGRRGNGGATVPASRWDVGKALRFYRNRILGGAPGRGHRHTVKVHKSGRRISVFNPGGASYIDCPHLAHVDLAEQDALIATLKVRNANLGRKPVNGMDPLARSSRKDSRFPSGPARCWYCGRRCVWGANGTVGSLMCSGSREWACWNSMGFDGALASRAVLDCLSTVLHGLDGFDTQFRDLVRLARQGPCDLQQRRDKLRHDAASVALERENVRAMIAQVGPKPVVLESLERVEAEEGRLTAERRAIDALALRKLDVPESPAELRQRFENQLEKLAVGPREFGRLLREMVVAFDVYLVRLADGGHLLPRARVKLSLDGIAPDARHVQGLSDLLTSEFTIDLFHPPQRELIRARAVELASGGTRQRDIAAELSVTQAAVQKAVALDAAMREQGLESPYVLVTEPPGDYGKLRRHRNGKYRFRPVDGYVRPPL